MNYDSIRAKLKIVSEKSGKSFMECFKELTFERFLARVSNSAFRENLIFKGGLCLKQYVNTDQETKDIDFFMRGLSDKEEFISGAFREWGYFD